MHQKGRQARSTAATPAAMRSTALDGNDAASAAALHAALAMIEDWDGDLGFLLDAGISNELFDVRECKVESFVPKTDQRGNKSSAREPAAKPATGKKRIARRDEIRALRVEADALEYALTEAKRRRQLEQEQEQATTTPLQDDPAHQVNAMELWKDVVDRQRHLRMEAEVENAHLRAVVQEQHKTATRLKLLVHRQPTLDRSAPTHSTTTSVDAVEGVESFCQEQIMEVDLLYMQSADIFSKSAFAGEPRTQRHVQFLEDSENGATLEFRAAWYSPFAIDAVADALWVQTIRMRTKDKTYDFQDLHHTEDSLVSLFTATDETTVHGGSSFSGRIASVRYREASDRIVLVSNMTGQWLGGTVSALTDVGINGIGWLRIQPAKLAGSTKLAEIQWSRRIHLRPGVTNAAPPKFRATVTSSMVQKLNQNLDWNLQMVENMLLDKCRVG